MPANLRLYGNNTTGELTLDMLMSDLGENINGVTVDNLAIVNQSLIDQGQTNDNMAATGIGAGLEEMFETLYNRAGIDIQGDEGGYSARDFIQQIIDSGQGFSLYLQNGQTGEISGLYASNQAFKDTIDTNFSAERLAADYGVEGVEFQSSSDKEPVNSLGYTINDLLLKKPDIDLETLPEDERALWEQRINLVDQLNGIITAQFAESLQKDPEYLAKGFTDKAFTVGKNVIEDAITDFVDTAKGVAVDVTRQTALDLEVPAGMMFMRGLADAVGWDSAVEYLNESIDNSKAAGALLRQGVEGQQGLSDQIFGMVQTLSDVTSDEFARDQIIDFIPNYINSLPAEDRAQLYTELGIGVATTAVTMGRSLVSNVLKSSKPLREALGDFASSIKRRVLRSDGPNKIKPSFIHGRSDGGKGVWGYNSRTAGSGSTWAQYQSKITGAPDGTEYLVKTDLMPSGQKWFDGYDPDRNVLLDAKRYTDWPKEDLPFSMNKVVEDARMESAIAKQLKTEVEWHIPNQEKADLVEQLLRENRIKHINVVYSPIGE